MLFSVFHCGAFDKSGGWVLLGIGGLICKLILAKFQGEWRDGLGIQVVDI